MDELRGVLDQVLDGAVPSRARVEEIELRTKAIDRLFTMHDEKPGTKLELYVELTEEIPLPFLLVAILGILRSHHWNRLPLTADLWTAARYAAGMHREQYRAGKYLPPPRDWPPEGQRYAITAGEFEPVSVVPLSIGPGAVPLELPAGEGF